MDYKVRFTEEAQEDFESLYAFLLERDIAMAEKAMLAIETGIRLLAFSSFSCRKAQVGSPFLRELLIPLDSAGYVALFEIEAGRVVTVVAVRHQREEDYH